MKKIYLVRHGQSETNAGGMAKPNKHIKLTDIGHAQAKEVANWVLNTLGTDIDTISVSKFLRTQQTAEPLLKKINVSADVIEGLEEFDFLGFSQIDGIEFKQRLEMTDKYWQTSHPDQPYGLDAESFNQFYNRVAQVLQHFKEMPIGPSGNHVVFTHGLWISMLIWQILGQPNNDNEDVRKFRQFEMSIRAKNCEVFCLTLADNHPPAITKARICMGQNTDLSA